MATRRMAREGEGLTARGLTVSGGVVQTTIPETSKRRRGLASREAGECSR
jgi:hypothetical protein